VPLGLVTGCAGFIGSHLTEELLRQGWEVIGIDNFHSYYSRKLKELNLQKAKQYKNFDFIEGSILSDNDLKKLPSEADYLFHFAAMPGVRNSILHPEEYFEVNIKGTAKILEGFQNVGKIIYASTSSVYGNVKPEDFPVKEDHELNPIAPYGESKKRAEELCIKFAKEHDAKIAILRFYTVYGPRQRPDEAFTKFIRLVQAGKPIPIYGDGNKERDFTFVSDIVNGSILAANKGIGTYNLGTGKPITINQMVSALEEVMKVKILREYVESPKGDVEKTHADISKARKELGYIPKVSFDEGVKQCVEWCINVPNV